MNAGNANFAWHRRLTAVLTGLMLIMTSLMAQDANEVDVKAAIVFNIARFTTWPTSSSDAFVVCILGRDEVATAIRGLEGKSLHSLPVRTQLVEREGGLSECRVLYVAQSEALRQTQIVGAVAATGRPILTVSDIRGFVAKGGMVGLLKQEEKVRFEVSQREVEARGMVMSSRLLQLALSTKSY